MKIKQLIAATLAVHCASCFAQAGYFSQQYFVNGSLLLSLPSNKVELTSAGAASPFSTRYDHGNKVGISAAVGYQRLVKQYYYLAGQFGIRTIFGRTTGTLLDGHINTPQVAYPVTFSLAFKPGIVIKQAALFYGLLGCAISQISMNQSYDTIPLSINTWQAGLLLGLGTEIPFSEKYSVGLLYQYEWYPAVNKFAGNIRNNFNDTLYPRTQTVALTLSRVI